MPRDFRFLGLEEIKKQMMLIDQAIDGGSQTQVGIEPRVSHSFAGKTDSELRFIRDEYAYAGYLLARKNPEICEQWPNPYRHPQITKPNFGGAVDWYGAGYPEI